MTAPLVSVIVVNWNRRELLRACLAALGRQTFRDFETIVVDNGSSDGSAAVLQHPEFTGIRLIQNHENRGFCAANAMEDFGVLSDVHDAHARRQRVTGDLVGCAARIPTLEDIADGAAQTFR